MMRAREILELIEKRIILVKIMLKEFEEKEDSEFNRGVMGTLKEEIIALEEIYNEGVMK